MIPTRSRKHLSRLLLVLVTSVCYVLFKNITLLYTSHSGENDESHQLVLEDNSHKHGQNDVTSLIPIEKVIIKGSADFNHFTDNLINQVNNTCLKEYLGLPKSVKNSLVADKYDNLKCSSLLLGNGTENVYQLAKKFMKEIPKKLHSDTYFQELIQDIGCLEFTRTRGYHLNPVNEEEASYPIAYNILIHKDVEQVEELLKAVYRPQNSYCIHVDGKVKPEILESVRAIASCFNNVFLASRLEKIVYAGVSRLQADINCMKDHVKSSVKWKYLLNTAGQGFPIRSNLEMVKILKIYNGSNDVEGIYGARVHRSRFENEWIEKLDENNQGKLEKSGKKNPKPPYDIDIVRGSAYGIFSHAFVEWLLTDDKSKALLEWSRKTWSPDEHYWATLHHTYSNPHLHTPGGYAGAPDGKAWLAVWVAWGGVTPCGGRWQRGTCLFGVTDLPRLIRRPEFMMNKFSADFEYLAQECMAKWIEYKVQCNPPFDLQQYKDLPFVKH